MGAVHDESVDDQAEAGHSFDRRSYFNLHQASFHNNLVQSIDSSSKLDLKNNTVWYLHYTRHLHTFLSTHLLSQERISRVEKAVILRFLESDEKPNLNVSEKLEVIKQS